MGRVKVVYVHNGKFHGPKTNVYLPKPAHHAAQNPTTLTDQSYTICFCKRKHDAVDRHSACV